MSLSAGSHPHTTARQRAETAGTIGDRFVPVQVVLFILPISIGGRAPFVKLPGSAGDVVLKSFVVVSKPIGQVVVNPGENLDRGEGGVV
jgi:hypothetical protein